MTNPAQPMSAEQWRERVGKESNWVDAGWDRGFSLVLVDEMLEEIERCHAEIDRLRARDAKVADAILVIHAIGAIPTGGQYSAACGVMREYAEAVKHE